MMTLPPTLLAISPGRLGEGPGGRRDLTNFLAAGAAAFASGLKGILVRESALDDASYIELFEGLRARADQRTGAWLGVHDRIHLVDALGADAGYLAGHSLPIAEARAVLGAGACLGAAVHAGDPDPQGVDFALLAPVFAPHSKTLPAGVEPLGPAAAVEWAERSQIPTWALGGIDVARIGELKPPLRGAATIGGLWGAQWGGDLLGIKDRTRQLLDHAQGVFG